jgi:hypothetical protein
MNKSFFRTLLAIAAMATLSACGGSSVGSGSNGNGNGGGNGNGNGNGGGTGAVTISFKSAPVSALEINLSTSLNATVKNDSKSEGVDWSCSPSATCGTFSAAHTASGTATTYFAPATTGNVTIKATAKADTTKTASATVAVTGIATNASLTGQYGFILNGSDAAGNPYSMAGSVTLDGNGNVTTGVEDYNAPSEAVTVTDDVITGGSYSIAANGTGTMTLNCTSTAVGVAGVQTLGLAVVNNNHVLINEFDAADTASGSLDLQTASAFTQASLTGGYSFAVSGAESGIPYVFGGVTTFDGNGNISNTTIDVDVAGTPGLGEPFTGDTYTAPDANGRGTGSLGGLNIAYYIVQAEVVRFVTIDAPVQGTGTFFGQGSNAGSFSAASVSGTFAFTGDGESPSGPMAAAGEFTADGTGNLTAGEADVNTALNVTNGSIAGTYAMGSNGYGSAAVSAFGGDANITTLGVYMVDPNINILDPNNTATGKGGVLFLDLDSSAFGSYHSVTAASSASFSGNYALSLAADNASGELDAAGQLAAASGNTTGLADVNLLFTSGQESGLAISGTYTVDSSNHLRVTSALTVSGDPNTIDLAGYATADGHLMVVETDTTQLATGHIEHQQ